jgi:hypothetical protein
MRALATVAFSLCLVVQAPAQTAATKMKEPRPCPRQKTSAPSRPPSKSMSKASCSAISGSDRDCRRATEASSR